MVSLTAWSASFRELFSLPGRLQSVGQHVFFVSLAPAEVECSEVAPRPVRGPGPRRSIVLSVWQNQELTLTPCVSWGR